MCHTIVMPVYNGERFLKESMDSVLQQSVRDFELVVCDDGSSDQSLSLLRGYASDSRVKVLSNPTNIGLFPTLNRLIRESQSEWVRLFAQDDRLYPGCLQSEIDFASRHPGLGMFYCHRDIIDEYGRVTRKANEDSTPETVEPWLADQITSYWGSMPGNIANVTLRKRVVEQEGYFDETMRVSGDLDMWVRIQRTNPIGFLREPLMAIRSHRGQFSQLSGVILDFLKEDRLIYRSLESRLPHEIRPIVKTWWLRHRGRQYAHGVFRSLVSGKFRLAYRLTREVSRDWNLILVFSYWLFTINGRLAGEQKPRYFNPKQS